MKSMFLCIGRAASPRNVTLLAAIVAGSVACSRAPAGETNAPSGSVSQPPPREAPRPQALPQMAAAWVLDHSLGRVHDFGLDRTSEQKENRLLKLTSAEVAGLATLSTNGDVNAAIALAHCYLHGVGGPRDEALATETLARAAERSETAAAFMGTWCYNAAQHSRNKDLLAKAIGIYRQAAERGSPAAQYNLAVCYDEGDPLTEQDAAEAFQWYTKAAAQGHVKAQANLGRLYWVGRGTSPDRRRAVELWTKAAAYDNPPALRMLGELSATGECEFVPRDLAKAKAYLTRGFKLGDEGSGALLHRFGLEGRPTGGSVESATGATEAR